MGLRIGTNIVSINAQRSLSTSQRSIEKSFAQLSTGSRINKASDDAAGLSLSENLRSQVRGFRQAQRNANDAVSMVQVAEGGLGEVSNILTRLRELGVQAASDSVGDSERAFINKEVVQMTQEMQRIAESARYGNTQLLDGSGGEFGFQVGIYNNDFQDRITYDAGSINATTAALGVDGLDFSDKTSARDFLTVIEGAQRQVNSHRATLGALQNRLLSASDNHGQVIENLSAANSRIRDTDIADATAELTKNNILMNASTSVLQQANAQPAAALKLIG
jgi:flagellin